MTYRSIAAVLFLVLGACDFDLGNEKGTTERVAPVVTFDPDSGTQVITNANGCTFVPCQGAYGTQCGFICPTQ